MTTAAALVPGSRTTPHPRPALTTPERVALGVVAVAVTGFGCVGFLRGVPGTGQYVVTVLVLTALVARLRRLPLSGPLALAAAASVVAHLAGGLVRVGDGVLYNASPGTEALRYDHFAHALGIFVGTTLLWELLVRGTRTVAEGAPLVVLALLAGLGLGAVNETIEFLATLAHGGGGVGGYTNTGWDLVVNSLAGVAAGLALLRRRGAPS
jgi:uncharacterized membrane protein YjdF